MPRADNGWHRSSPTSDAAAAQRQREYKSPTYRAARTQAASVVASGRAHCWRCGQHIHPGQPWHLGHDDHDRTVLRGTECVRCSLSTAARRGALKANARRKAQRQATQPRFARRTW